MKILILLLLALSMLLVCSASSSSTKPQEEEAVCTEEGGSCTSEELQEDERDPWNEEEAEAIEETFEEEEDQEEQEYQDFEDDNVDERDIFDQETADQMEEVNEHMELSQVKHQLIQVVNDKSRTAVYRAALTKYVKQGDSILDLGAGFGLLSMIANSLGGVVTAVEFHEETFTILEQILEQNELTENITALFLEPNGVLNADLLRKSPVDVLVSSIFDGYFIGEGFIPLLAMLRTQNVISSSTKIIPSSATVWLRLVRLRSYDINSTVEGFHFGAINDQTTTESIASGSVEYRGVEFLSQDEPVFTFDFTKADPLHDNWLRNVTFNITSEEKFHGLLISWNSSLDEEGQIQFGNKFEHSFSHLVPYFVAFHESEQTMVSGQTSLLVATNGLHFFVSHQTSNRDNVKPFALVSSVNCEAVDIYRTAADDDEDGVYQDVLWPSTKLVVSNVYLGDTFIAKSRENDVTLVSRTIGEAEFSQDPLQIELFCGSSDQ